MAKRARLLLSTLVLAPSYLLLASAALAAPPADEAAAEMLFNQATEAANAGRLDEACPKFAEAQRLDPTAGTLLNLGKCEEQRGNLATAYGVYIVLVLAAQTFRMVVVPDLTRAASEGRICRRLKASIDASRSSGETVPLRLSPF